jgi:chromosome segregation ATPase
MGSIFQQILDSENIFKAKNTEINEKQEQIENIKKQIEKLKSHSETVICDNINLRAKIDNQRAEKELLQQKREIVGKQLTNMKGMVDLIKSELNELSLKYQRWREDIVNNLSSHSKKIMTVNANVKQMDAQKYEIFCRNELELEALQDQVKEFTSQRGIKQHELEELNSKATLMGNNITTTRDIVAELRRKLENIQMSSDRTSTFNKMKMTISNYEAEISSMVSEINNKRLYIKKFKKSTSENDSDYLQRHSTHFNQPRLSISNQPPHRLMNMHHPYQPQSNLRLFDPSLSRSERMVVTRPPVPSTNPEEDDDLFDDDLICDDVLKACDEAQKLNRGL